MTYVSHGSSKELFFDEKPTAERATEGVFKATNEFSIFDKGGTSEKSGTGFQFVIPLKFISMDEIIRATYEAMKETGVPTCYIGPEAGGYGSRIKVLRVPGKDGFPKDPLAIPVGESVRVVDAEAIFNFYVHPKSSLLRNFKSGK